MTALDLIRDLGEPGATIAAGSEGGRNRTSTGGRRERTKKWVHIENMYPLLTFRRLFVHHLRISDVAVSRKKSLSAPYPHCFVSLRNRGLQVRILPGVLTYVDLCPELCPVLGHTLGHSRQYFTDPAGILLDGIAQVILLCGAEISMPH